jgi:ABC-type sugar transport system ATPase subunit
MSGLTLKNLVKTYDDFEAIHSINLEIESGEFVVLVGPSGCGKSTVLRMIAGLEQETSGEVYIAENNVTKTPAAKRGIAMVFQSYALYPHMTVRKNLGFGLENIKSDKAYIEDQVSRVADILHLTEYLDRLPSLLSGGQRQRVAIGRAIVRNPKIFLFDEPLSNLDADLRVEMRHEIRKLHKRLGSTMIYVTHDQTEAMTLADRIVVLNAGKIAQAGTPLALYNEPANTFVASFIGSPSVNLIEGEVAEFRQNGIRVALEDGHHIDIGGVNPALSVGKKITLGMRPEHLSPLLQAGDSRLGLAVDAVECLGDATYIYGKFGDSNIRVKLQGQHSFDDGHLLEVGISSDKIMLFDASGDALPTTAWVDRAS